MNNLKNLFKYTKDNIDDLVNNVSSFLKTDYDGKINDANKLIDVTSGILKTEYDTKIKDANDLILNKSNTLKTDYTKQFTDTNQRITEEVLRITNEYNEKITEKLVNVVKFKGVTEKDKLPTMLHKNVEVGDLYLVKTIDESGNLTYDEYVYTETSDDKTGYELIGNITNVDLNSDFATKEERVKGDQDLHDLLTSVSGILNTDINEKNTTLNNLITTTDERITADINAKNTALNTRIDDTNSTLSSEINRLEEDYTTKDTNTNKKFDEKAIELKNDYDNQIITTNQTIVNKFNELTTNYKNEITEKLVNVVKFMGVVDEGKLPAIDDENVHLGDFYLVRTTNSNGELTFDEYVYVESRDGKKGFDLIGNITNVDLNSDFATKEERVKGDQDLHDLLTSVSGLIDEKINNTDERITADINAKNTALNTKIDDTNSTLNSRITSERDELSSTIDNNKFIKYINKSLSFKDLNSGASDLLPGHFYKTTEGDSYFFNGETFQLVGPITTTDLNNVYAKKSFTDNNYIKEVNTLKVTDENHGVINLHMANILDNEKYAFNDYVDSQDTKLENKLNTRDNELNAQTIKLSGEVNTISGNLVNDISKTNETIQTISTTITNDYTKAISDSLVKVVKFKGTCESYEKLPKQYNNSPNAKGNTVELGDLYIVETEFTDENHNNKTRWDEYVFVNKGTDEIPVYDYELIGSIENVDLNGDFATKEYVSAADKNLNDSINEKYQELTNSDKSIGERITSEVNILNETINTKHDSLNDRITSSVSDLNKSINDTKNSLSSSVDNDKFLKFIKIIPDSSNLVKDDPNLKIGHFYRTESNDIYFWDGTDFRLIGPIEHDSLVNDYGTKNWSKSNFIVQVNGKKLSNPGKTANGETPETGAIVLSMDDIIKHEDYALTSYVNNKDNEISDKLKSLSGELNSTSGLLNNKIDNSIHTVNNSILETKNELSSSVDNDKFFKFMNYVDNFESLNSKLESNKPGHLYKTKTGDIYFFDGTKFELVGPIEHDSLVNDYGTKDWSDKKFITQVNGKNLNVGNRGEDLIDPAGEPLKQGAILLSMDDIKNHEDYALNSRVDTVESEFNEKNQHLIGLIESTSGTLSTNIDNDQFLKFNNPLRPLTREEINAESNLKVGYFYKTTEGDSYVWDGTKFELIGPLKLAELESLYSKTAVNDTKYIQGINKLKPEIDKNGIITLNIEDVLGYDKYALSADVSNISSEFDQRLTTVNENLSSAKLQIKNDYEKYISDKLVKAVKFKSIKDSFETLPSEPSNVEVGDLYLVKSNDSDGNLKGYDEYLYIEDEITKEKHFELIGNISNGTLSGSFATKEYVDNSIEASNNITETTSGILKSDIINTNNKIDSINTSLTEKINSDLSNVDNTVKNRHYLKFVNSEVNTINIQSLTPSTDGYDLYKTTDGDTYFWNGTSFQLIGPATVKDLSNTYAKVSTTNKLIEDLATTNTLIDEKYNSAIALFKEDDEILNKKIDSSVNALDKTVKEGKYLKYITSDLPFIELNKKATVLSAGYFYNTPEGDSYFYDGNDFKLIGSHTGAELSSIFTTKTWSDSKYIKSVNGLTPTDDNHGKINLSMDVIDEHGEYAKKNFVTEKENEINNQISKIKEIVDPISGTLKNDYTSKIDTVNQSIGSIQSSIQNISDKIAKAVRFISVLDKKEDLPTVGTNPGDLYLVKVSNSDGQVERYDEYVYINSSIKFELIGNIRNADLNEAFAKKQEVTDLENRVNSKIANDITKSTEPIISDIETIKTNVGSLQTGANAVNSQIENISNQKINELKTTVDNSGYFKLLEPETPINSYESLTSLNTVHKKGDAYILTNGDTYIYNGSKFQLIGPITSGDLNDIYLKKDDANREYIKNINGININDPVKGSKDENSILLSMDDIKGHENYALTSDLNTTAESLKSTKDELNNLKINHIGESMKYWNDNIGVNYYTKENIDLKNVNINYCKREISSDPDLASPLLLNDIFFKDYTINSKGIKDSNSVPNFIYLLYNDSLAYNGNNKIKLPTLKYEFSSTIDLWVSFKLKNVQSIKSLKDIFSQDGKIILSNFENSVANVNNNVNRTSSNTDTVYADNTTKTTNGHSHSLLSPNGGAAYINRFEIPGQGSSQNYMNVMFKVKILNIGEITKNIFNIENYYISSIKDLL